MKTKTKTKKQNKEIITNLYNVYAVLMTMLVSAVGGFGLFWIYTIFTSTNIFFNMFLGMMFSAGLYNVFKSLYPLKK